MESYGPIMCGKIALLRVLEEDEGVKVLAPTGVFDSEKPISITNGVLPWVVMESATWLKNDQLGRKAGVLNVTLTADHDTRTNKTLQLLADRIYQVLDRNAPLINSVMPNGWSCWESNNVGSNILTVSDDLRRMVVRYELNMQECK